MEGAVVNMGLEKRDAVFKGVGFGWVGGGDCLKERS